MSELIRKIRSKFEYQWNYLIKCKGDKIRYLRSQGVRIGEGCDILCSAENFGSEPWLIEIGNNVTFCDGAVPLTHDAASRLFRKVNPDMNARYGNRFGTIRILDNCFIGINTLILPGITIGPNSVVGTGSVVTKNVAPGMVVAGNPAHEICTLEEYIERYRRKMIPLVAESREELRRELTRKLWGEER